MNAVVQQMPQQRASLVAKFAAKYSIDPDKLLPILKSTAFKVRDGEATNEQMAALMVVADQYGLNPFTKEIYAFPDKGGIVPVVGVDGWSRIINDHPQSDGVEFRESDETTEFAGKKVPVWMEAVIYRKDRSHPTRVRERFDEVRRDTAPWKSHPCRMLRHKALIQGARVAYGFTGIFDEDEAERIVERIVESDTSAAHVATEPAPPALPPAYPADQFATALPKWADMIAAGKKTADQVLSVVSTRYTLSDEQIEEIRSLQPVEPKGDNLEDS